MPSHETSNNFLKMIYNFHFFEHPLQGSPFGEIKALVALQNRTRMMSVETHLLVNKPRKLN